MARLSYKEQLQRVREDAIVEAVNRLLTSKGYDAMTVDEVAAEAGMAKASVYKHFASKEELAVAAMVRALDLSIAFVDSLREQQPANALEPLQAIARWAMSRQLAGEMPTLPSQNSTLTAALQGNDDYVDRLLDLSNKLSTWITTAQTSGQLHAELPVEMVLYILFARACDPVVALLKESGQYSHEQIMDWAMRTTFHGLVPVN